MNIYIETERLYIRELLTEDEPGLLEMDSDPEVHRYIANRPLTTMGEIRTMLQLVQQQYVENGVGRWAVLEKETDEFLGWTGFKLMKDYAKGYINHYDFGYRFKRSAWGRGFATESARAALKYGIETLRLNPIFAMTDINNAASRHVLEKIGFRFVEIFDYTGPLQFVPDSKKATWYELPGQHSDI